MMSNSENNIAEVIDSFKTSDDRLIAFLKSQEGRLPDQTKLIDGIGQQWKIKQYLSVWGGINTIDIIKSEESQNTFQYLVEGINHNNKPIKGAKLRIIN